MNKLHANFFGSRILPQALYSDNGSEVVNSKVLAGCEAFHIPFSQTQPGHPWSNGKAETAQRWHWFNYGRSHFGAINRGLTPAMVVQSCAGLDFEAREETLANLRAEMRGKNRAAWQQRNSSVDDND